MYISKLRDQLNMSQAELASITGIPRDRIAKWEQGKGKPKKDDSDILQNYFREKIPNVVFDDSLMNKKTVQKNNNNSTVMQVLLNISENNKMLSEAALKAVEGSNISAQASLLHAQSISKLTDHSNDLMNLVKSTEHAAKENLLNDDEKLVSALGRLVVKRMGVEWHSEQEAVSVLSRRVLESLERSGGNRVGAGK